MPVSSSRRMYLRSVFSSTSIIRAISCCWMPKLDMVITWRRSLQAQHRSTSPFDAAMVLLKSIVEVATRSMSHLAAKLKPVARG